MMNGHTMQVLRALAAPETPEFFGARLAHVRKLNGMTQQELADVIGVHWVTISKLERGLFPISVTWAVKICDAFDADILYFLVWPGGDWNTVLRRETEHSVA